LNLKNKNKKMKTQKILQFIFLTTLWVIILISFFLINEINYKKIKYIKLNTVEHPENLATKEFAKATSFGFKNLKADKYWLETIQYIWWNAINSKYKKYLYSITDVITELNPFFEHPYLIAELLLPDYNPRYENLSKEKQEENKKQAEKIWLKWVKNFCNEKKLEKIKHIFDLRKLQQDKQVKNPCKSHS